MKTRFDEIKSKHVNQTHPMIVIDANLIGYKTPKGIDAAKCVEFIACSFSSCGVRVLVHADHPTKLHHAKRESIRRKCEKEKTTVKLHEKRNKLSSLLQNSETSHMESCDALSKDIRSLENQVTRSLLEYFVEDLTSIMLSKTHSDYQDNNSMHVMLKIANNQVDPNIVKCVVDGEVDAVLSGDSDFATHLRSSCDYFDMMIKDVIINKKDVTIQTAKVVTSQQKVSTWIELKLLTHMEGKLVFPRICRKGKNGIELEIFENTSKHP